jgi:hypothetical protein
MPSSIRHFENGGRTGILPLGWRRRMHMKRYSLSMIGLAIVTVIIANPGIAFACNKLIGT